MFWTQSVCIVPHQNTRNIYHKQMNNGVVQLDVSATAKWTVSFHACRGPSVTRVTSCLARPFEVGCGMGREAAKLERARSRPGAHFTLSSVRP